MGLRIESRCLHLDGKRCFAVLLALNAAGCVRAHPESFDGGSRAEASVNHFDSSLDSDGQVPETGGKVAATGGIQGSDPSGAIGHGGLDGLGGGIVSTTTGGTTGTGGAAGTAGNSGSARGGNNQGGSGVGTGGTAGSGGKSVGTGGTVQVSHGLSGSTTHNFGSVEIGVPTEKATWTIKNDGSQPTGGLTLSTNNASEMATTNACVSPLAAGESCTVSISFKASTAGARAGTITMTASPGGTVTFGGTATGQYRITLSLTGGGTVTSSPLGLACGSTCSGLFDPGTITLQARPTNGSNKFFSGWGGPCSTILHDCALDLKASISVTATFATIDKNLIFISSASVPTNRGNAIVYDGDCNVAASAAGINSADGKDFIAYVSDSVSLAKSRIPSAARGWMRMDGKPFADSLISLLVGNQVLNPLLFDETGAVRDRALLPTGTNADGTLSAERNCLDWTSPDSSNLVQIGAPEGGPVTWSSGANPSFCSGPNAGFNLICMGTTRNAVVAITPTAGKKIWVTSSPFTLDGSQTPDAKCQADRPGGVTTAAALIATTTKSASANLNSGAVYVRPDGTRVGTGAQIALGGRLESGIWQSADGAYLSGSQYVWSGSTTISTVGSTESTCGNWADPSRSAGTFGNWAFANERWWNDGGSVVCSVSRPIYCIQTSP